LPQGKRKPAEVPTDIIDTANKPLANLKLNQFVSWQANPFQLNFKYRSQVDPSNVLTIHGMLYDSYLNWIDVTVNTLNEADFSGVFGLGQRASKDFFIQDGVYSMWARDQPTPDETGSLPGANMYGTHPYFMYKHKKQAWVGVFYNLANAQDWWIKNDINGGKVNLTTVATGGVADIYVIQGQTPDAVVQNYFSLIGNPVLIPQWALGWH
jgi:alpha-glucosidase (family GH31 glycosyl hydrolase)